MSDSPTVVQVLRKLIPLLDEYDFPQEVQVLLKQGATAVQKMEQNAPDYTLPQSVIDAILADEGSLRAVAERHGVSHEYVRKVRRQHNRR